MKKHSQRFLDLVNESKSKIDETDVQSIRKRQTNEESFHLVDVREPHEWQKGHLPNAIYIGKGVLERDIEGLIPQLDAEIVLYCGGGFRSAIAAENLLRMGYSKVSSMDGGYRDWTNAGFPVETTHDNQD
jgi:rhodanese-related sulfurtransferase